VSGKKKKRILFRLSPFNRLSFPVLLNAWEQEGIDREFEVVIRTEPLTAGEIRSGDAVLFSFMTSVLPYIHQEIVEIKKSSVPDLIIAGGGPHVSGEQELVFEAGFDTLFCGPGERNFVQWGKDLLDNRPLQKVYHYQASGSDDFNPYIPVSKYIETIPPLEIMRGCYWRCNYCSTHLYDVRFRTLESIDTHLREMKKRKLNRVNFISPSSMEFGAARGRKIDLEKIEALLELMASYDFLFLEYGIFPSEIRPDTVTGAGMKLLKQYVINKSVTIGAQSGSDVRLRELRRGHNVEDICQAIEIANANDFLVNLDFIVGYPDETPDERHLTVDLIRSLARTYRIRTHLHHFIPLAGSPYAYRFPSFLPDKDKEELVKLKDAGIAVNGWEENEKQAVFYLDWLKHYFPGYYEKYGQVTGDG
jgi:B12-binding domain/radical SAM domain protein